MKVLVIGGCGFIGSHIVDHLLFAGHEVHVLSHSPERYREPLAKVQYHLAEMDDPQTLEAILPDMNVIVHAASSTVPSMSVANPLPDIDGNLKKTVQLLEQMRLANVHRIIFLSSGGTVYGNPECLPIPEDHPLEPLCSYGVIKVAIERFLLMYQHLYGFQPLILRPSNPYGPRQGHTGQQGVIATFLHRIANGEPVRIWGDGSIIRDFFHVSDLARLCTDAVAGSQTGIFNVGSGTGHSLNQLLEIIADVVGASPVVEYLPPRSFDVKTVVLDTRKVREAFDWQPLISLEEGISDLWQSIRTP